MDFRGFDSSIILILRVGRGPMSPSYMCVCVCVGMRGCLLCYHTPNLPTNIVDFRGFDSSIILTLRGGVPRPIGDFPESLSQTMLVGLMFAGRLGVNECDSKETRPLGEQRGLTVYSSRDGVLTRPIRERRIQNFRAVTLIAHLAEASAVRCRRSSGVRIPL